MSLINKNFPYNILILSFLILIGCQFQEPSNNHGIVFLENRSNKLKLNESNLNDVINIIGQPHTKSINNDMEWIYIERILTKGEYHKLGRNILKENNVLILNFDKYGILKNKKFLDKNDIKKMTFSSKVTTNELTQRSFVEKFLQSIKTKMYGNKN
jgi:outer membrane protein assembly factor BamE (lipoprotein component of BamABCDE complex)